MVASFDRQDLINILNRHNVIVPSWQQPEKRAVPGHDDNGMNNILKTMVLIVVARFVDGQE